MNIREPFENVTEEHYDEIMAVNLKGLYFLTQTVVKHMIPRKQGKIIHIGSLTTDWSLSQISVYTATKGAVGQLAKAQALELGQAQYPGEHHLPGLCGHAIDRAALGRCHNARMGRIAFAHKAIGNT